METTHLNDGTEFIRTLGFFVKGEHIDEAAKLFSKLLDRGIERYKIIPEVIDGIRELVADGHIESARMAFETDIFDLKLEQVKPAVKKGIAELVLESRFNEHKMREAEYAADIFLTEEEFSSIVDEYQSYLRT